MIIFNHSCLIIVKNTLLFIIVISLGLFNTGLFAATVIKEKSSYDNQITNEELKDSKRFLAFIKLHGTFIEKDGSAGAIISINDDSQFYVFEGARIINDVILKKIYSNAVLLTTAGSHKKLYFSEHEAMSLTEVNYDPNLESGQSRQFFSAPIQIPQQDEVININQTGLEVGQSRRFYSK